MKYSPATNEEVLAYSRGLINGVMESATPNVVGSLLARIAADAEKLDAFRLGLELILPMARGYAREHQVGNNARFIAHIESLLRQDPPVANAMKNLEISDEKLATALETVLGKGIESVWLRRTGGENGYGVQVLTQIDGDWFVAIEEDLRANFSHCAHLSGSHKWPLIMTLDTATRCTCGLHNGCPEGEHSECECLCVNPD